MDEKAKQAGRQSDRREAAEGRLRQALVGLAKAGRQDHRPTSTEEDGEGPNRSGRRS